jgi:hypothetical protein
VSAWCCQLIVVLSQSNAILNPDPSWNSGCEGEGVVQDFILSSLWNASLKRGLTALSTTEEGEVV